MAPTTQRLHDRAGVAEGARFLDLGCGGGHVSFEAARRVGPRGAVTGVDLDETKLELAPREAAGRGLANGSFVSGDARDAGEPGSYDFAHARFLLTHLADPGAQLDGVRECLKSGGAVIVEDIDASPFSAARAVRRLADSSRSQRL